MGKEENREGLKLDMLMEDKKEEGRIAKEREKEIRKLKGRKVKEKLQKRTTNYLPVWENKRK